MQILSLTGLVQIELPGGVLVQLCDGGYITWGASTFQAKHPIFGSVSSLQPLTEGMGDEIPALELVLIPSPSATAGDLVQPGYQQSRCRFWIADYNPDTCAVVGTPNLQFDGMLDQSILRVGKDRRELALTIVATIERLFEKNIGNSLNSAFHKSVWPGETAHDNASGLSIDVAWGTTKPTNAAPVAAPSANPMWRGY